MRFDFAEGRFVERDADPEKPAVLTQDRNLSWRDLESSVEHLCGLLDRLGVPSGHPVVVYGHKEAAFVAAFLACIRSLRPYVPCDVSSPPERVALIAAQIGSKVLIDCTGRYSPTEAHPVVIGPDGPRLLGSGPPCFSPLAGWDAANPVVYLLFTSGSTGGPKGVPITRRAVLSFLDWISADFGWSSDDRFFNQATFAFDLSMYETLGTLHLGATVVLTAASQTKDTRALIGYWARSGCTLWISTPSFAAVLLTDAQFGAKSLPTLRQFVFCGERLSLGTAKTLMERFPAAKIINTYGPTEATVATTRVEITQELLSKYSALPVGYPKRNSLIEIAQDGEILILGDHVAEGYFAQPELNARKFFVRTDEGRPLRGFRTGDQGHFEDGMLFFSGRTDHQLKLHGYRIDLVEIDEAILRVPGVAEAMTIPLVRNEKVLRLVSFVSPKSAERALEPDATLLQEEIRKTLIELLPGYMMPSQIRVLGSLPHSTSHKVDRNALIALATQAS